MTETSKIFNGASSIETPKAKAELEREKGNSFFREGGYYQAIEHYSRSVELDGSMTLSYLNRALMYLRTECPGAAIHDTEKALQLLSLESHEGEAGERLAAKAYYRQGYAKYVLGHTAEALACFKSALRCVPSDAASLKMRKACEKDETRRKFLLAIASEEVKRPYQFIDWKRVSLPGKTVETSERSKELWENPETRSITHEFIDDMLSKFRNGTPFPARYATRIFLEARSVFASFPNAVPIDYSKQTRLTVCGDIHGQFFDLMHLFETNGFPSKENPYLFNGDVVDRGAYGVECLLTLCAFKILLPNHFFLARGNHEGLNLNKVYGFENEIRTKYSSDMFDLAHDLFRSLPLCHIIGKTVFVVHGGLFTTDGVKVEDINKVDRSIDIPESGLMCDMLWSDPQDRPGRRENKRGVGVAFGPDITENFLDTNNFQLLVRSHEVKQDGFEIHHGGKCITVFSAPNYCGQVGNKAAYLHFTFDDQPGPLSSLAKPKINQFDAAVCPSQVRSFMDQI
ncbi:Serine/threonine-protein phosphatase [Perkinsela sp. CCAP 1560/4]|nr:Serine/threonine-protein phosphatase [Perkinsela sp. CCAP 1560/4]|eukprot:KNH09588.1 Serine/threonine-protein phosphatase [Perkinsela sp. CCAP 1560/4]